VCGWSYRLSAVIVFSMFSRISPTCFQVIFCPKFRRELNFIEPCWDVNEGCQFGGCPSHNQSFSNDGSPDQICNQIVSLYGWLLQRVNWSQAAWAAKRYRGHRDIPSTILAKDNITNGNFVDTCTYNISSYAYYYIYTIRPSHLNTHCTLPSQHANVSILL
jgi:hypothetical protein